MKRSLPSCMVLVFGIIPTFVHATLIVPKIANVAGVRVGLDTVEKLEQEAGPAEAVIGGHPRGGRLWQSRQTGWYLWVDGFYYNDQDQRIIDFVSISLPDAGEKPGSPSELYRHSNLPRRRMLFMNTVAPGMTKSKVLQLLRTILPPPRKSGNELVWESKGFTPLGTSERGAYEEWTATLYFEGERLSGIKVDAE